MDNGERRPERTGFEKGTRKNHKRQTITGRPDKRVTHILEKTGLWPKLRARKRRIRRRRILFLDLQSSVFKVFPRRNSE
jgi:hypothetical protein